MCKSIIHFDLPKILEAGCGTAATLRYLKKNKPDIEGYGLDSSLTAVNIAKAGGINFSILQADAFDLPFSQSFRLVYSVGLIEHFSNDEALDILLQQRSTALKNGYIGVAVPAKIGLLNLCQKCIGKKWPFATENTFNRKKLKELLQRASLINIKIYYIYFMALLGIGKKA